jgi:hypothetical protein
LVVLVVKRRRRRRRALVECAAVKRCMSKRCMMLFVELKAPVSAKLLLRRLAPLIVRLAPLIKLPLPLPLPHLPHLPLLLPLIEIERQRLKQTDRQTDRQTATGIGTRGGGQTRETLPYPPYTYTQRSSLLLF